ncbi:MAG: hypothetical protein Q4C37_03875 [Bacteroidales bacterium]|nr:hypothetical protein [Bacteroidales bacterium]
MINLLVTALMCLLSSLATIPDEPVMTSFEIVPLTLPQVDLSRNPITYKLVNKIIENRDSTETIGYYALDIKNYRNGYLVRITQHSDSRLFYYKGYDGYFVKDNVPVIIDVTGSFKLYYHRPKTFREFKMKGEFFPPTVYDPKEWWFYISNGKYKELDDWTGMEMWNGIYKGKM